MKAFFLIVAGVLLTACGNNSGSSRTDIVRIDTLSSGNSADNMAAAGALRLVYGDGSASDAEVMERYRRSQATNVFLPDVQSALADLSREEEMLGIGLVNMKGLLPAASIPSRVYGYVTPYMQSVVLADSVMLIGLNHYLGADYPGYDGFENYKKMLKVARRIPFDVIEAILYSSFPYSQNAQSTALSRMLYEGAVVYAVGQMMPDADAGDLLGYTKGQIDWADGNEAAVWRTLAEKELLYSVDPLVATKLISPSPASAIVHPEAPGRIGRYIGYGIVLSYMKNHKSTPLNQLLSPDFYNSPSTLMQAEYRP